MGENYIKQVQRELHLSPKVRREIVRDLNEIFASATEHGETEEAVIQRPAGAIGHADAMTTMQIEGAAVDLAQIILLVGAMAAAFAVVALLQIVCDDRRSRCGCGPLLRLRGELGC